MEKNKRENIMPIRVERSASDESVADMVTRFNGLL